MSKYKVGDRVVVISKEEAEEKKNLGYGFANGMKEYCGKTVTIKKVDSDGTYKINEDAYANYWWSEEFFEGLEEDTYTKPAGFVFKPVTFDSMYSDAFAHLAKASLCGKDYLKKLDDAISLLKDEKENNTMNKKDILAVRNYKDRAMVMQFDKKDKNGKNVQTRAEVHDGDTFDLDNGIRICLLKYLLGGHKEYMAIMDAARKSYKKTVKEDQKKAAEHSYLLEKQLKKWKKKKDAIRKWRNLLQRQSRKR